VIREIPEPEPAPAPEEWRGGDDWIFFYRSRQMRHVFKARCAGLEEEEAGRCLVFRFGRIRGRMPEAEADAGARILAFPGRFLYCRVVDIRRRAGEVVLSRRLALAQIRPVTWSLLRAGLTVTAAVEAVYPGRGALVDVGGVRALLPAAEMAWGWVADPRELVRPGQLIRVSILAADRAVGRVKVSLKALQEDPWRGLEERYRENARYLATVTGSRGNAVFVCFEPGVSGCCRGVGDVPPPGTPVVVQLTGIDPARRKIAGWLVTRLPAG